MDPLLIIILAFTAGYWAHSRWWGSVAAVLVSLGGGVLRDVWLGLPLWVLGQPQYLILAALTGFLASGVRFPADTRWVGMLLLVLDFGASVAFGVSAGERTFALTRNPEATALGSVLTASGGGFLAALIGRHLLSRANDRGGANEL
ncbi:TRIC cation channel family protein [Thermus scotoductus]|uniref:TRIC cation channel family protein n=1 Tax=Thermus scotoductus TaxID=37636 RepID=UPI003B82F501